MARAVGRVENLVVEDREIEGQSQADGVGWRKLGLSNVGGALYKVKRLEQEPFIRHVKFRGVVPYLVGLVGSGSSNLTLLARGKLGKIAVIITLPVHR